jgi:hypothetical protein
MRFGNRNDDLELEKIRKSFTGDTSNPFLNMMVMGKRSKSIID